MVDSRFMQQWQPREVEGQLRAIPKLLKFITASKMAIGLIVLLLLSAVIVLPFTKEDNSAIRIALTQKPQAANSKKPKMINPRYESIDAKGQPFTITAKEAIQTTSETVQLLDIQADIALNNGSWIAINAHRAALQLKKSRLYLYGNIRLFSDEGYELRTDEMFVDMKNSIVSGDKPIHGQGPFGTIQAQQFDIATGEQIVKFKNNVKLTIYP